MLPTVHIKIWILNGELTKVILMGLSAVGLITLW